MSDRIKHVNRVELIGNAGMDGKATTLPSGSMVARVSVATSRSYKDREGKWVTLTTWHNVSGFGDVAEELAEVKKGDVVHVLEGQIEQNEYTDREGNEKTAYGIKAWVVKVLQRASEKKDEPRAKAQVEGDDGLPF